MGKSMPMYRGWSE